MKLQKILAKAVKEIAEKYGIPEEEVWATFAFAVVEKGHRNYGYDEDDYDPLEEYDGSEL